MFVIIIYKLWEDASINRLREDIGLFRGIVNLDVFRQTHRIVILNKYDLFKKNVNDLKIPFSRYFKNYKGNDENHIEIMEYIIKKLLNQIKDKNGTKPYIHFFVTNALNTANTTSVFHYIHCNILNHRKVTPIQFWS